MDIQHNTNRMGHFLFEYLEGIFGFLVAFFLSFHIPVLTSIPPFYDAFTIIVFKFIIACVCGVGGGIGGLAVKYLASLFKKDEKKNGN